MTTVKDVVIDHDYPEDIEIITGCQDDAYMYWEDVAEEEALSWCYFNGTLEIEI